MQIIMTDPPLAPTNAVVMPAQPAANRHSVQHRLSEMLGQVGNYSQTAPQKD
jgi:hypothetical protein